MLQDSINLTQTIVKDTVFIPTYLERNPMDISDSVANISCKNYIINILQDSYPMPKQSPTMFLEREGTGYKTISMQERPVTSSTNWIFLAFSFVLLITALEFKFSRGNVIEFLSGCFYKTPLGITAKDGERVHPLSILPVLFIFLPVIDLLLYSAISYFDYEFLFKPYNLQQYTLFLALYVASVAVYFLKILFIKFFGWVFRSLKVANYYVQLHFNFNFFLGLLLILPVFCSFYVDSFYRETFLFISLFIVVLEMVIRLIRTFLVIIGAFKFSHLYLFFYLCTIELLPIIIVCKLLFF